jgi:hypothetical protein
MARPQLAAPADDCGIHRFLVDWRERYDVGWAVMFATQCRPTFEAAAELARERQREDPERRALYVHRFDQGSRHAWRPVSRWLPVARLEASGRLVRL